MKNGDFIRIGKLTEEGKAVFSCQFDETQDMDEVRAITNPKTGELVLAIKISKEKADQCVKLQPITVYTEKGVWKLWHDGWNYIINREGDRV